MERVGFQIWIVSLAALVAIWLLTRRTAYQVHPRVGRLVSVFLLTPLVYVGHPFVFAPVWTYAGLHKEGVLALASLVLLFGLVEAACLLMRRRTRRNHR